MSDETPTTSDPTGDRRPLLGLILAADRRMRGLMEEVLEEHSLPLPEHTALAMLRRNGALSSAELARKAFVTPQAMGQIIASIERRGLIQRRPDPNHGRRMLAELTPAGLALVNESLETLTSVEQHFLTPLSPREREYFLTLFTACVEFLETHPTLPGSAEVGPTAAGENGAVAS